MYSILLIRSFSPYTTTPIYTPDTQDMLPLESGRFTLEINEGGSLEFTLPFSHPFFDTLEPMSTFVTVRDDTEEVFYGRIYDRSDPTLTGRITYQGEGALSFLQDSEIPPESKNSKGEYNKRTMTAEAFFRWCIERHNADVNDPRRQFTVGQVTATRKNESDEYQITSYTETKSAISQYILDRFGGMLRVRAGSNGVHYIDWVQDYGVTDPQPISIGSNVTDMTTALNGEGFFTVLRPVGANGLTLSPATIDIFPADKMAKYGRIIKSEIFNDADTAEKLRQKANLYISRMEKRLNAECQVSLVDFHFLNGGVPKIRLGHMFSNIRGLEGETMTVTGVDQDILKLDNGQYTLKNSKELGTVLDGRVRGGTMSKAGARGASAGGMALKYYHELENEAAIEVAKLSISVEELNVDVSGVADVAADALNLATNNYESISHVEDTVEEIKDVSIAGLDVRIRMIEGAAVIQDSDHISNVAGNFEVWEDQTTHKKTVHLTNGAEIAVDKANGGTITVGELTEAVGRHEENIDGQRQIINEMTGSALWTQKDQITGVSGQFEVVEIPDPNRPGKFLKRLKIVSGGGMVVSRGGTEYGVYDNGNLTGGTIVTKLGDGTVKTFISGNIISIKGDTTLSGTLDIDDGALVVKQTAVFRGTDGRQVSINNGTVSANDVSVKAGGAVQFVGSQTGEYYNLQMSDVAGMIVKAEVDTSTNTLKMWKKGDAAEKPSITFKKAASTFSGAWSGSQYNVTADQNGSTSITMDIQTGTDGNGGDSFSILAQSREGSESDFTTRASQYLYVREVVNGASSKANVCTGSDGTGVIASVGTGNTYAAGQNAVAINKGAWSGGLVEFNKSAGTASRQEVRLSLGGVSWDGNTATVEIWDGTSADAQHGSYTGKSVTVNASARYNSGYDAEHSMFVSDSNSTTTNSKETSFTIDPGESQTVYPVFKTTDNKYQVGDSCTINARTATHSPTASGYIAVSGNPGDAFEEKSISPGYGTSWYTYNASCGGTEKKYKLKVNGPVDKVTTIYPTTDQPLNAGGSVNVYARSNGTDIASVNVYAKSVVTSASDFTKQSGDPGSAFTQKSISPGYGTNWYTFQTTGTNGGGTTNYKLKVDTPADRYATGVAYGTGETWFWYTNHSDFKNAEHGNDDHWNDQGVLGYDSRIAILRIYANGKRYVAGTWGLPASPNNFTLESSEPDTSRYIGDLTSSNSDRWYALRGPSNQVIAKLRVMKASGGGSSDSYENVGVFTCKSRTSLGGAYEYTFTFQHNSSSAFSTGSNYTFYRKK